MALAGIGINSFARVSTNMRDRSYLTIFPCVSAAGDRLPLSAILKGKTSRCLRKIREDAPKFVKKVKLFYSTSGKMQQEVLLQWMQGPLLTYTQGRPAALLLDSFRVHFTPAVQELAQLLRVELIQVPAGMTPELQPLDVKFNGPMKAKRMAIWRRKKRRNPFVLDSWQATVDRASEAFSSMSKAAAREAWKAALLID